MTQVFNHRVYVSKRSSVQTGVRAFQRFKKAPETILWATGPESRLPFLVFHLKRHADVPTLTEIAQREDIPKPNREYAAKGLAAVAEDKNLDSRVRMQALVALGSLLNEGAGFEMHFRNALLNASREEGANGLATYARTRLERLTASA